METSEKLEQVAAEMCVLPGCREAGASGGVVGRRALIKSGAQDAVVMGHCVKEGRFRVEVLGLHCQA